VPTDREITRYYWPIEEAAESLGYSSVTRFRISHPNVYAVKYDGKKWVSPTVMLGLRKKLKRQRELKKQVPSY
jgi:hypothetical protein